MFLDFRHQENVRLDNIYVFGPNAMGWNVGDDSLSLNNQDGLTVDLTRNFPYYGGWYNYTVVRYFYVIHERIVLSSKRQIR